jgi:CheY-like chemotaxis protein
VIGIQPARQKDASVCRKPSRHRVYGCISDGCTSDYDRAERAPNMAQASVLVVDSYRGTRELVYHILCGAGYRCLLAADGQEAMEVFRRERPELVVTGVRLQIVNGVELLWRMRHEDRDTAVIVMTGDPAGNMVRECYGLGAFRVLIKPFIADELLIFAERALERRQLLIERRQRSGTSTRSIAERPLAPGQTKTVNINFAPTTPGDFVGTTPVRAMRPM